MSGIANLLGVTTVTVYRRINRRKFSLEGIPQRMATCGTLYDMEAVFKRVFPGATTDGINSLMYDFMQKHGGQVI